jgi:predicted transcriptional regulator
MPSVLQNEGLVMKNQENLSDPIALRMPRDVLDELEKIAAICERSRSWVMVRALRTYLAAEGKDIQQIHAAKAQMADGKHHDLDDVMAELDAHAKGEAA